MLILVFATIVAPQMSLTLPRSRFAISFSDASVSVNSMTYTTTVLTGDADNLLEPGELFKITLTGVDAVAGVDLNVNDIFRLTVQPASGAYLVIQRTLPGSINETVVKLD